MTAPHSRDGTAASSLRLSRTVTESRYRRLVEDVMNDGRIDAVGELVSRDAVVSRAGEPEPLRGPDGITARVQSYRTAFSDHHLEVESVLTAGTQLVARWTMTGTHDGPFEGVEPTGVGVSVDGVHVVRVENGAIVELWELLDTLTLRRQLGMVDAVDGADHVAGRR